MSTWAIWRVDQDNPEQRQQIGELVFQDDGSIQVNSKSKEFMNFVKGLDGFPTVDGEEMTPDDPDFDIALTDYIQERSEYRYILELLPEDDEGNDEEEGATPPPPPPPSAKSYAKVRRLES